MKNVQKRRKSTTREKILDQVEQILEARGRKALEMAKSKILEEQIECKQICEALYYFINHYWQDVARPALLSLACEAVGGDPEITIPIAIAMIFISGGIDIHDDIIDQSKTKRSRPTVLGKFGKDIALLLGDALIFKGLTQLHEAATQVALSKKIKIIIQTIEKMFFELGDAEALELQLRGRTNVTPEEYLHVVRKKAADVEAHTRISALIGGGSQDEIRALSEYGRLLGMTIILRDDLMDMLDPAETRHRIIKEHLPLQLLHVLQKRKFRHLVNSILTTKRITEKDAAIILEITHKAGGFKYLRKIMRELANNAISNLSQIAHNQEELELLVKATLLP